MKFELPIRIQSVSNLREHWRIRSKRSREQRSLAKIATSRGFHPVAFTMASRITVKLTRLAARGLDGDNLAIGFKHVRDGIADAIGIDDGSEIYRWEYAQEKQKGYGIRVEIEVVPC